MSKPPLTTLAQQAAKTRSQLQLLVFLVVFPATNLLLASMTLYDLGLLSVDEAGALAVKLWLTFGLALVTIRLLARVLPGSLSPDHFWRQLFVYVAVIVAAGVVVGPALNLPADIPRPGRLLMPRVVVALETVVYLAIQRMLYQQARAFEAEATLRKAELNVLRSQSNPHFLFNTLNLISAEITEDPENAREIVFDLADLLRINIRLAEQTLTTLGEEMRLVTLYLTLQQKRFKDRLTFSIDLPPEAAGLPVPSLLLQPIVENTVKHGVAPYASPAHIRVETALEGDRLSITFRDTGPCFDDAAIEEGNGFRILRETLDLHYGSCYELALKSAQSGGLLTLSLPVRRQEAARD